MIESGILMSLYLKKCYELADNAVIRLDDHEKSSLPLLFFSEIDDKQYLMS